MVTLIEVSKDTYTELSRWKDYASNTEFFDVVTHNNGYENVVGFYADVLPQIIGDIAAHISTDTTDTTMLAIIEALREAAAKFAPTETVSDPVCDHCGKPVFARLATMDPRGPFELAHIDKFEEGKVTYNAKGWALCYHVADDTSLDTVATYNGSRDVPPEMIPTTSTDTVKSEDGALLPPFDATAEDGSPYLRCGHLYEGYQHMPCTLAIGHVIDHARWTDDGECLSEWPNQIRDTALCSAGGPDNRYVCTSFMGHGGIHIAGGIRGQVVATWPNFNDLAEVTDTDS